MKSLLLIRHAEAVAGHPDPQRSLSEYGHTQAKLVGQRLAAYAIEPSLVLCSSAVRAEQTAGDLVAAAGWQLTAQAYDELYNADTSELIDCIAAQSDDYHCILLVAHAPGVPALISELCTRNGDLALGCEPATVAEIVLDIAQWKHLSPARGVLKRLLVTP